MFPKSPVFAHFLSRLFGGKQKVKTYSYKYIFLSRLFGGKRP